MTPRRLAMLITLLVPGCGGLVMRLGIGPRIDGDGHVGAEVFVAQGFRLRESPAWPLALVRAGRDGAGHGGGGLGLGLELARTQRLARPSSIDGLSQPARMGYRAGLAALAGQLGDDTAGWLEASGGALYPIAPVVRADLGVGGELSCAVELGDRVAGAERLSCRPAAVLELSNTWKPPTLSY
jgi:hypothetical protein